ncbi:MAG: hypothetical protein ABI840_00875 [bacterium]
MAESTRTLNITPEEIQQGKTMAIVAYLIFFIPLLMEDMRNNKFVMYHTEQSILIVILYVIVSIVGTLTCGIGMVLYILCIVLQIIGIMNAANGEVKPLPLIGQYGEKFNLVR